MKKRAPLRRRLWSGSLCASYGFLASLAGAPVPPVSAAPNVVESRVAASGDDAEQLVSSGAVNVSSTDLELVHDVGPQAVGLRFGQVSVPRGARITRAWVQFQVDEPGAGAASLRIRAQAADDAAGFTTATNDVSARPTTTAFVDWNVPAWTAAGDALEAQRTPDLAPLVQEVVDRPGWSSGRALALVLTGSGKRVARSYDGNGSAAPLLHVEYEPATTTVDFQGGALPEASYAGAKDTTLSGDAATTTGGDAATLTVDGDPDRGVLLAWDVGRIPSGSTILSASISVGVTNPSTDTYEVYEVKRSWSEAHATWGSPASGSAWGAPGASGADDRGTTVLATLRASSTGALRVPLNASGVALIQRWVNQPATNLGLLIADYTAATDSVAFHAREASSASLRPRLTVEYRAPVAGGPVAVDDAYQGERGGTLTVPAPGVLGNDGGGSIQAAIVTPPAHGSVSLNADGGFTYTPAAGHAGLDSFTYRASGTAGGSQPATVRIAVAKAPFVIHLSVDGLRPDAITRLGAAQLPNFYRFRTEGAFTDNARADFDHTITLPNHTSQITGRRVAGANGHNWTVNTDPAAGQTLHSNKGAYVASAFDVAHDHGLSTALFATKSKFVLYDTSFDATNGAADPIGPDHGKDKIDFYFNKDDMTAVVDELVSRMKTAPARYAFLHLRGPDSTGHSLGWDPKPGSPYSDTVKQMDALLGKLFTLVDGQAHLKGRTVIVLTSDHGGSGTNHVQADVPAHYTIPFYAWGAGVARGRDLYELNPQTRRNPDTTRTTYADTLQPIRNGDVANLVLSLLGLPPVPGSTINKEVPLQLDAAPNEMPAAAVESL